MALPAQQREYLKSRVLPPSEEVIAEAREYMARAGLSIAQFAHRLGYSSASVGHWISGSYSRVAGHDKMIRARFLDYRDANPLDVAEFDGGKLYETENVRLLREDFYRSLDRSVIIVRHGNPGTQKSYTLRYLVAELNRNEAKKNGHGRRAFRIYCGLGESPLGLMRRVAHACAVPSAQRVADIIRSLQHDFRNRRGLLVFDEAQHLTESCLEVIRELNDEPPHFGLMFIGSHDLSEKFSGFHLEQLRSRLDILQSLPGMSRKEAAQVVQGELPWMRDGQITHFIEGCVVRDKTALAKERRIRGSKDDLIEYVSARDLFCNIREVKQAKESTR